MKIVLALLFASSISVLYSQDWQHANGVYNSGNIIDNLIGESEIVVDGTILSDTSLQTRQITKQLTFFKDTIQIFHVYSHKNHAPFTGKLLVNWVFATQSNGYTDAYNTIWVPHNKTCFFFLQKCSYDSTAYQIFYYLFYDKNTSHELHDAVSKSLAKNKWYRNENWKVEDKRYVNTFKNVCIIEKNLIDPTSNKYLIKSRQINKIPKGSSPTSGIAFGSWNWIGYHYKTITEYYDLENKLTARSTGTYYCIKENVQDKHPKYYLKTDSVSYFSGKVVSKVEEINSSDTYGKTGMKTEIFNVDKTEHALSKKPLTIYIKGKMSKKQKAKFLPTG